MSSNFRSVMRSNVNRLMAAPTVEGIMKRALPLSEHPALLPDELKEIAATNPESGADIRDFRAVSIASRGLLRDDGTAPNPGQGDHEGICSPPWPRRVHKSRMAPEDFLHRHLNRIIRGNEHGSTLPRPCVDLVVHLLQLDQHFLARHQPPFGNLLIEPLPQGREDLRRVCPPPSMQERTCVEAVVQAAAPALSD